MKKLINKEVQKELETASNFMKVGFQIDLQEYPENFSQQIIDSQNSHADWLFMLSKDIYKKQFLSAF